MINPANTFASVKRFIGRTYAEVREEEKAVSFRVEPTSSGGVALLCPQTGKRLAPEEVSAEVLRKLAADASKFLGAPVKRAVVTVPGAR